MDEPLQRTLAGLIAPQRQTLRRKYDSIDVMVLPTDVDDGALLHHESICCTHGVASFDRKRDALQRKHGAARVRILDVEHGGAHRLSRSQRNFCETHVVSVTDLVHRGRGLLVGATRQEILPPATFPSQRRPMHAERRVEATVSPSNRVSVNFVTATAIDKQSKQSGRKAGEHQHRTITVSLDTSGPFVGEAHHVRNLANAVQAVLDA
jgi:hypothetical protein